MNNARIIATVRGTEAERAILQVAAHKEGLSLAQYLRYKLDLPYTKPTLTQPPRLPQ